jgi:hypothetical protein
MSGTAYGSQPIRKVTTGIKMVKNWSYEKSETAKLISWMQSIQDCNKKANPTKIALYGKYQVCTLTNWSGCF